MGLWAATVFDLKKKAAEGPPAAPVQAALYEAGPDVVGYGSLAPTASPLPPSLYYPHGHTRMGHVPDAVIERKPDRKRMMRSESARQMERAGNNDWNTRGRRRSRAAAPSLKTVTRPRRLTETAAGILAASSATPCCGQKEKILEP